MSLKTIALLILAKSEYIEINKNRANIDSSNISSSIGDNKINDKIANL